MLELFLHISFDDKFRQQAGTVSDSEMLLLHSLRQRTDFRKKFLPDPVDFLRLPLFQSPVAAHPVLIPLRKAPDSQRHTVILQLIDFPDRQIRQAAAQAAKYTFITEILRQKVQKRPQILHKRIHQNRMLFIQKIRDAAAFHHLPGIGAVVGKAAADHREIPELIPFHPDQFQNRPGHIFQLPAGISGRKNPDGILVFGIFPFSVTKQIFFQKIQSFRLAKPALFPRLHPDFLQDFHPLFPGHFFQ